MMFQALYQLLYHLLWLLAIILLAPIYFYRLLVKGKYRNSTLPRFGFQTLPDLSDKHLIWLHSVSLGESQVAVQVAAYLKTQYPQITLAASSCTETGQAVLKQSEHIDVSFYYPFDFYFLIKKLFARLNPKAIIIMETDLWPNMLSLAENNAIPVYLVNAKISEKTFAAYQHMPWLKNCLLNPIKHFYCQCESYQQRFISLGIQKQHCTVTGNVKLDRHYPQKSTQALQAFAKRLGLNADAPVLVFASSHEGEESAFIQISEHLWEKDPQLQCVFVPRHPERFNEVAKLLQDKNISFHRSSQAISENNRCLLVDQMGILMSVYELATIAVVAGSFTDKVGGHNIFEPAFFGKAIIYGPWIFKQPGLHDLIQEQQAAIQIQDKNWQTALERAIEDMLADEAACHALGEKARAIIDNSRGITAKVLDAITDEIRPPKR